MHDDANSLIASINQWGLDRNITAEGGATVMAQMSKMMEEFAEFLVTYNQLEEVCASYDCTLEDLRDRLISYQSDDQRMMELNHEEIEHFRDLTDDFGDMLVCLIQAIRLAGLTPEQCLSKAWEDIKDRKGTMINGKFVKES